MFGAVLGAVATVMYYNQGEELSRVRHRVMDKSRRAVDAVTNMADEDDFDMRSEG
jgi:hypothetical protein